MTDKFADMAARLATENKAEREDAATKAQSERDALNARVDADIESLERNVMPDLQKATAAFAARDWIFTVTTHYDVRNRSVYVAPALSLRGESEPRKNDKYVHAARPVFFTVDGTMLTVSAGRHNFSREGDGEQLGRVALDESASALIEKGVEQAVQAYLKDVVNAYWPRD